MSRKQLNSIGTVETMLIFAASDKSGLMGQENRADVVAGAL